MIRKVTIDELDVEEPLIIMEEEVAKEDELQETSSSKWYRSRLFIISGLVVVLVVLIGVFSLWMIPGGKNKMPSPASRPAADHAASARSVSEQPQHGSAQSKSKEQNLVSAGGAEKGKPAVDVPAGTVEEEIQGFMVLVEDKGKKPGMLAFDLVVEIGAGQKERLKEKMALIRASIYKAAHAADRDILIGKNGMHHLREIIRTEMETSLGRGFVKEIRFSKYVVL